MAYVLHLAGMDYSVLETQEPEEAKRFVADLDLNKFDGLCVVGGDGLLQEVGTQWLCATHSYNRIFKA